jgi:uncharacterized protein (DUF2249 family)
MTANVTTGAVESTDRVSDVLARDEGLIELFVRHSPHFAKLRNRSIRRVMARLVTVGDAARMAGIDADKLVAELNAALGATEVASPLRPRRGGDPAPPAASRPAAARVVELDVREDLRVGREPFSRIMAAVGALHDDEVLLLRAIFEPVPLFALLWKRGFAHESVERGHEDWWIWLWQQRHAVAPESPPAASSRSTPAAIDAAPRSTVVLDVRGLEPPEPLRRTLAALEELPDGHELLHVNVRVPQLLLPMLAERGFACELDESHADRVLVRIWRPA